MFKGILSLFVIATLTLSCGHRPNSKSDAPITIPPKTPPTFAEIKPILQAKCAPCHADTSRHTHLIEHEDVFKGEGQEVGNRITSTDPKRLMPMPRGGTPLTEAEKSNFLVFLGKQPPAPDSQPVTYDGDIAPLVNAKCAACHGDNSRTLKFAGHEDVILRNADNIADRISTTDIDKQMPPVTKVLADDEKAKILDYLGIAH